jgi:hypothetical protein
MKSLFEGIAFLFTDVLFVPFDMMRELELTNWWAANAINWLLILVCMGATAYWIKQLSLFKKNNEDNQDTTAHSFLS